jgi:curved DNA-binding protein CbpA
MNLYETLEIKENATNNEIKKAYFKLAKIYHPDKKYDQLDRFQQINYAYNILINEETRKKYNSMNVKTRSKFYDFLLNLISNNITKDFMRKYGITIFNDFNNINELNSYLEKYTFNDLLILFIKNKISDPVYEDNTNCSDSDINAYSEFDAEYYQELPIYYQKFNKNNINIDLDINLDDLKKNRIRILKIKKMINNKELVTTYNFNIKNKYVIFNQGGDNIDDDVGHLIIKLNLPENFIWDKCIYFNKEISLYDYLYGINLNLNLDQNYKISWLPIRDGKIINIDYKIGIYDFKIILNTKFEYNKENYLLIKSKFK